MRQLKVRILENKKLSQDFYKMRVESSYLARNIKPGQFMHVRCSGGTNPLLRRPFSVHRILKDEIEILYEVVGKGTEALARRKREESLDIIGPLGNGFNLRTTNDEPFGRAQDSSRASTGSAWLETWRAKSSQAKSRDERRTTVLVAGGMGVAPLVALAEELAYSVERIAYRGKKKIYALIGAKTKSHILCEKDFKKLGAGVLLTTEDGSKGYKGLATDVLKDLLSTIDYRLSTIYACGPNAMLKEAARTAKERRIPCQVSLEERMACGVGVCLGCPVKVKSGEYRMVCKDGPVFNADEIEWQNQNL